MKRAEAEKVAAVLQGLLDAFGELSAEVTGKRAANWGVANKGLLEGDRLLAKLRSNLDEIEI